MVPVNLSSLVRSSCSHAALAAVTVALALLTHASLSAAGNVAEPPPSLTHYRCYICHSDRETLVGPAFADVAAFYRGTPDAVSKIATDIRRGIRGGGPWHMPPHPEVSPEEARAMARYIMSLAPRKAATREVQRP